MIICVEDDGGIRDLMIYALNAAGYEAKGVTCGRELSGELKREKPTLIMLDIMLPGESGIEILKKLRQNPAFCDIPIIMATAKGTEYDKVIGLDLGADDYLAKPFGMMEMVSRVRAVLRRTEGGAKRGILRIGNLTVNTLEHTVTSCGERVALTRKEYELLKLFMENPRIVFTRDRLLESIWDAGYITETRTVDVHINTLRAKLGECGDYIVTVRGVGYRMEVSP